MNSFFNFIMLTEKPSENFTGQGGSSIRTGTKIPWTETRNLREVCPSQKEENFPESKPTSRDEKKLVQGVPGSSCEEGQERFEGGCEENGGERQEGEKVGFGGKES